MRGVQFVIIAVAFPPIRSNKTKPRLLLHCSVKTLEKGVFVRSTAIYLLSNYIPLNIELVDRAPTERQAV